MKVEPTFNLDYWKGMGDKPIMAGTDTRDARSANYGDAFAAVPSAASTGKAPRTPRGEKTLRKILDAALAEFGSHGFSESSIVGITRRARVALGTFYTYFDSKDAVFAALVRDMSARVRDHVVGRYVRSRQCNGRPCLAGVGGPDEVVARKLCPRPLDEPINDARVTGVDLQLHELILQRNHGAGPRPSVVGRRQQQAGQGFTHRYLTSQVKAAIDSAM